MALRKKDLLQVFSFPLCSDAFCSAAQEPAAQLQRRATLVCSALAGQSTVP